MEQEHTDALQALKTAIHAQLEETRQALHHKYDRSRAIALYVAKLLAEGVATHCNIDVSAVTIESPAYFAALEELQADLAEEEATLEASFQQAEEQQRRVLTETHETNLMILQHEHDLRSLQESLQSARDAQQAALRDRLAKRRAQRATELMEAAGNFFYIYINWMHVLLHCLHALLIMFVLFHQKNKQTQQKEAPVLLWSKQLCRLSKSALRKKKLLSRQSTKKWMTS